ncbi:MAG: alpha/beta fold hydrolase [Acidobacteriaceae bacterium]|nr:alpha/beta fold hydrolase [Acidobacteriaceae bacterium]
MPYATNKGVRLYWEDHGSGPPVLLIMGLSFSHEMWFRVLPCLAAGYRVILYDNRGIGRSDIPRGPYFISDMAQDAAAVLAEAGESSAHIVGASMGGMIAQELALQKPELVRSLLLGCTSYSGLFGRWPKLARLRERVSLKKASRREWQRAFVPLLYADSTPLERIREDLEVQYKCVWTSQGFLNQFAGILLWSSYLRLPRLRVPTLVVHGDEDCLIPPQNGRVVAARIPGAGFRLVSKAGHILTTDQPEACQDIILEFLRHAAGKRP